MPASRSPRLPSFIPGTTFFSLPPELRIRVYEYALNPLADPGAFALFLRRKGHSGGRCCAVSLTDSLTNSHRRCGCSQKQLTTGLLRTNKQIFAEAIEVLCNLFELRVRIPGCSGSVTAKEMVRVLEMIPEYAQKHMRQLLLVSDHAGTRNSGQFGVYADNSNRTNRPDALAGLDKYWKTIREQLPELRKLRIQIDLFKAELENIKYVLWAFKGIKTLKKLQHFRLEIHQRQQYMESAWSVHFMENVQADIICRLMKLEGNFEIDVVLIERSHQY